MTFVRPSLSSYTIRHPGGHSGFAAPSQMASFQESRGCDSRRCFLLKASLCEFVAAQECLSISRSMLNECYRASSHAVP